MELLAQGHINGKKQLELQAIYKSPWCLSLSSPSLSPSLCPSPSSWKDAPLSPAVTQSFLSPFLPFSTLLGRVIDTYLPLFSPLIQFLILWFLLPRGHRSPPEWNLVAVLSWPPCSIWVTCLLLPPWSPHSCWPGKGKTDSLDNGPHSSGSLPSIYKLNAHLSQCSKHYDVCYLYISQNRVLGPTSQSFGVYV